METVTLLDLGPILAAVLGPMLLFVAASMRYQHVDSAKTRELIVTAFERARKDSRELINEAKKENLELHRQNRELIRQNRDLVEKVRTENREQIESAYNRTREEMSTLITRNHDLIMRNHDLIMNNSEGLSDVRERLGRIEGHLRIVPPPEHESDNGDDAARAA
ncbi:MAG: hypothetical protein F4144_02005 [Acidimicrobiaceae bacterium]|nr:hypothetical protein [Acidimicrobiaceae bacterium]MYG98223.1 hypothetical protein [Acidimicrobiaceae bacterium]